MQNFRGMKIVDVDQVFFFLFPFSLFLARPHDSCKIQITIDIDITIVTEV